MTTLEFIKNARTRRSTRTGRIHLALAGACVVALSGCGLIPPPSTPNAPPATEPSPAPADDPTFDPVTGLNQTVDSKPQLTLTRQDAPGVEPTVVATNLQTGELEVTLYCTRPWSQIVFDGVAVTGDYPQRFELFAEDPDGIQEFELEKLGTLDIEIESFSFTGGQGVSLRESTQDIALIGLSRDTKVASATIIVNGVRPLEPGRILLRDTDRFSFGVNVRGYTPDGQSGQHYQRIFVGPREDLCTFE